MMISKKDFLELRTPRECPHLSQLQVIVGAFPFKIVSGAAIEMLIRLIAGGVLSSWWRLWNDSIQFDQRCQV